MVALSLHSQPVVTSVCIDPLRVPEHGDGGRGRGCSPSSGYRNVYWVAKNHDGADVWSARVKVGGTMRTVPGSRSTDPRRAAQKVAEWYAERFGADWGEVLRGRKRNPWT